MERKNFQVAKITFQPCVQILLLDLMIFKFIFFYRLRLYFLLTCNFQSYESVVQYVKKMDGTTKLCFVLAIFGNSGYNKMHCIMIIMTTLTLLI